MSTKCGTLGPLLIADILLKLLEKYQTSFQKYYSCQPDHRNSRTRWKMRVAPRLLLFGMLLFRILAMFSEMLRNFETLQHSHIAT